MKQYNSKPTAALSTRGFYAILRVCGLIIAASAWVLWSSASRTAPEDANVSAPISAPTEALPDLTADQPVDQPDAAPAQPTAAPAEPEPEQTQPAETVHVAAPVYVRPASGAVITPFSDDELLFQVTFGDWRVHSGTDIAAEPGEAVLALTDGSVQDVFEDGLYGTCVTITHDADLTTTYRGLSDVRVVSGQAVSAGEAIGACSGAIAAEAALDPHIHVEAARAGVPINVLELLGEHEPE